MAEMSKSDWAEKDKRISKLACLKAAVEFCTQASSFVTSAEPNTVLEVADKFQAWVYNETTVENLKTDVVSDTSWPTPTQEQKKALEKVEKETGKTASQVWAQFKKYPTMENVDKCIAKINEEK